MAGKIRLLIADDEVKFVDSIAERLEMRGLAVAKAVTKLLAGVLLCGGIAVWFIRRKRNEIAV